jgi:RNA polymerase sigma-70 factor (ECF subfamily)
MTAAAASARPRDPELDPRFAAVYHAHVDHVWRSLRRLGVTTPELDDAVQETFIVAFRRWDDMDDPASWRPWLSGIARRVASHHRRGRGRRLRLVDAVRREPDPDADPDDEVALRHAARLMQRFLQSLAPRRREVFVLAEIDGRTGPEIADALQLNVNAVWSRLRSARASFDRFVDVLRARERGAAARWDRAALLRAARRQRPVGATRRHGLAMIAVRLGTEPVAVATSWLGAIGPALASIALGAVMLTIVAVVAGVVRGDRDAPPSTVSEAATMPLERPRASSSPGVEAREEIAPAKSAPPAVATHAEAAPSSARAWPTKGRAPRARKGERTGASERVAPPAPAADVVSLRAELELVQRIRAATSSGRHEQALALVERHAQQFPAGELTVERDAQRIAALCALGRDDEARGRLDAFRRAHRSDPPRKVVAACPSLHRTATPGAGQQQ